VDIALVTGCSSGIGYETALDLARDGYITYASMRDVSKGKKIQDTATKENLKIEILELNVDKPEQIKSAVAKIVEEKKRIDVLVNNAGYGLFGCTEDISIDELKARGLVLGIIDDAPDKMRVRVEKDVRDHAKKGMH